MQNFNVVSSDTFGCVGVHIRVCVYVSEAIHLQVYAIRYFIAFL